MNKTILFVFFLGASISSAFAARVTAQSTDSYGHTLYTIECSDGSWSSVSQAGNSYASIRYGITKAFNSLGEAAAYTCGE